MVLCNLSIFYAFMSLFTYASIHDTVLSVLTCLPAAAWSSNLTHIQGGPPQCIRLCACHCQGSGAHSNTDAAQYSCTHRCHACSTASPCQYFPSRPRVFTSLCTYDVTAWWFCLQHEINQSGKLTTVLMHATGDVHVSLQFQKSQK